MWSGYSPCVRRHLRGAEPEFVLPPERPNLFATLDHRAWLRDWFSWKRAVNRRFSHRVFARMAGQKSPSLLLLVIRGERSLTPRTTAAFIRALDLEPEEEAFFRLLVQLDAADKVEERNAIFLRIAASQRFKASRAIEGEGFRYLSHWYLPAIRELAACPGFQADPVWIARTLRPRIRPAEARAALDTLFALGMLVKSDDGEVTLADADLVTPHEVAGLAVHNYHRGMLARATDAIEAFRPHERHLGAVTVAVPNEKIPTLKAEIAAFQERVLALCDGIEAPSDRVMQLNLQLFPLSAQHTVAAAPAPAVGLTPSSDSMEPS
jgi:uncharacterized protein (TIGR02147 family)